MPKEKPDPVGPAKEPVPFKPRPETLRDLVHRLASDTDNISWSTHAQERMYERGLTDKMAIEVLQKGDCKGEVEAGAKPGEWKLKLVRRVKGKREAGVVVLTVRNARLFVKTAEWEDL
jgi:Domain of unknown function (DUF4258)